MPIVYDHKNNPYKSISEMCKAYGIPRSAYDGRKRAGMTVEEILTTPVKSRPQSIPAKDFKGIEYPSETAMCRRYGISRCTYRSRLDMGWTQEEALTGKPGIHFKTLDEPIIYNGKEFWSYSAIGKEIKISDVKIKQCVEKGFTIDEIIKYTSGNIRMSELVVDEEGIRYPSIGAMCKAHGTTTGTFSKKVKEGKSVGESLQKKHREPHKKIVTDPDGREFGSIIEMCKAHGVSYNHYNNFIRKGRSVREALTPYQRVPEDYLIDLDGVKHKTTRKLCDKYGITKELYLSRLRRGLSKEEALSPPDETRKGKADPNYVYHGVQYTSILKLSRDIQIGIPTLRKFWEAGITCDEIDKYDLRGVAIDKLVYGPNGRPYRSEKAMCADYGVCQSVYRHRIAKKGMSKEEALTYDGYKYVDWTGMVHNSFSDFLKYYGVDINTGRTRRNNLDWTDEEIVNGKRNVEPVCVVDGISYVSFADLCRKKKISACSLYSRMDKGMSAEEAVHDILKKKASFVYDHEGNPFKSETDMCRAYGIKPNLYKFRSSKGLSKKEALTTPVGVGIEIEYNGKTYDSASAFCKEMGITLSVFLKRLKEGYTVEESILRAQPKEDHTGEEITTKCGLKCKLIKKKKSGYIAEFEDGTQKDVYCYSVFKDIAHPSLYAWNKRIGHFCGYAVKYMGQDIKGNVWYETEKDGKNEILTPQMMLRKSKECNSI